ncbi:hypothetical protein O997_01150 [Anaplasma phagocytophilum str. MRK]|nr:hypothetical protein O997_01150 [Anaplasma phagocytophilum str. MRK]
MISHSGIGNKVCVTKKASSGGAHHNAEYAVETDNKKDDKRSSMKVAVCGAAAANSGNSGGKKVPEVLRDFVRVTLKGDGSKNWPTSTGGDTKPNDNAKAVAKDLVEKLTPEEKTIVAGLLAKTIEGGEVVEICVSP